MLAGHKLMKMYRNFGYEESLKTESYTIFSSDLISEKNTLSDESEIKIITDVDDFDLLRPMWSDLVRETNTHIFQTYEWNRSWWEFFGADHNLLILMVYSAGVLIGIAPFFKDTIKIYNHQLYSCLRLIGSSVTQPKGPQLLGLHSYSGYLDFIIKPGFERTFYRTLIPHLKSNLQDIDEIVLDEIPEESTILESFTSILDENNLSYKIENDSITPVIQLESTWDLYLKKMNSKERNNVKRYLKRSRDGKAKTLDIKMVENNDDLQDVISELMDMHQKQWNERGFAGTFAEQRMRDFASKIIKCFYQLGWLKIMKAVPVSENGNPIAYDVLLTYKDRVYLLYRSMETDDKYRKQAPGIVLLYTHIFEAIQKGATVFNFLRGGEEYKLHLADKVKQNKRIKISFNPSGNRILSNFSVNMMLLLKHAKLEWVQAKYMIRSKTFTAGVAGYVKFITGRINHKLIEK